MFNFEVTQKQGFSIANCCFNSVSFDEEEMQLLYDNVWERVKCSVNEDCINIDISVVKHSISKLKAGKHDGFDRLSSDFILNGTELLDHHLSTLFTLIWSHCYAPVSFCMSTMIYIPKGSGSMGDIKNYRGVALTSTAYKAPVNNLNYTVADFQTTYTDFQTMQRQFLAKCLIPESHWNRPYADFQKELMTTDSQTLLGHSY